MRKIMALTLAGSDSRRSLRISLVNWCLCLAVSTLVCQVGLAQRPPAQTPPGQRSPATQPPPGKTPTRPPAGRPSAPPKTPATAPKAKEEIKPPPPESSYLRTKDGWSIYCTYFGPMEGVRNGKEVVPVILLHGWEGQGAEYGRFATLLQTIGCAVAVPDLRGHGRSTSCRRPDRRTGELKDEEIKVDDLTTQDLLGMTFDVEAVKKMLMEHHNKAELNIEMLCVGGADVGAIVAINWTAMDWSWPVTPSLKQGQDVKGLILLSPRLSFKGLNAATGLAHPAVDKGVSAMVAVGKEERREYSDAKRIYSRIENGRETYKDPAERRSKQDCFFLEAPTLLQGTRLLDPQLDVYRYIGTFLKVRFFDKADQYPWAERKSH
jgi:alpha-beta hydrolase superfamily lysophospholipase